LDRSAPDGEGSGFASDGTEAATVGTGLLLAEMLGLSFEEVLESSLVEAGDGGLGDLFHEIQIGLESGAVVPEGTPGDDFAPPSGELPQFLEFFGCEGASQHGVSYLGVRATARSEFPNSPYQPRLAEAKRFMASFAPPPGEAVALIASRLL
jgi:hypothetical protein